MSSNPWGSPAQAPVGAIKLHDVMDHELAAKLQREEEQQWESELTGRGAGKNVGWCFVEVPSGDCEYGVMSVVQQEISMDDAAAAHGPSDDDPDYTFALELQAQEAEEYDRLRRQEASSTERIRVIQQEHPKHAQIRQTLERYYTTSESSLQLDDDFDPNLDELSLMDPIAAQTTSGVDRLQRHHLSGGMFVSGRDLEDALPKKKFSSLSAALKKSDRKHPRSSSSRQ